MLDVMITTEGTRIAAVTPYDETFVDRARQLGGKYTGNAWTFDARDAERVADLCREVYGTDGTDDPATLVTVRITIPPYGDKEYRAAGRSLVRRPGRDMPVRYGAGVVVLDGAFPSSGGSVKNPRLDNDKPVMVEVRDVAPGTARLMVEQAGNGEIIRPMGPTDALRAERARLVARIAEIDAVLGDEVHLLNTGGQSWCGDYNVSATVKREKATCPACLAASESGGPAHATD